MGYIPAGKDGRYWVQPPTQGGAITPTVVISTIVAVAVLHVGQEVFLPLAIALLITFALSPLVTMLRKLGLPMLLSVLAVVTFAFLLIGAFLLLVVSQLGLLAQNLPTFQANILTKLEALQGEGSGLMARLADMLTVINERISAAVPGPETQQPMPVEVVEKQSAVDMLRDLVLPLISPVATTGLVMVVVIFMLLEREELRDRFIRLIGANDLHRTTELLEDAGARVGQYLLMQLLVNTIYAVPVGLGLWMIGVPNALLWGMLTLVLRFVPYIGSVLAAAFPLFLSFAVSPDWSAVLWTGALFAGVEALTSNVIEPWLYGSRTGASPLAIIVAAIFWTWIWGPLGLVLSTPLTVCLVVLGRHIPQFKLFDILFGDEPVLPPHARLYQRLLAGDAVEAAARADEALRAQKLEDYYRDTGIPALLLAQSDYDRGVLSAAQEDRVAEVAGQLVNDMAAVAEDEGQGAEAGPGVTLVGGRTSLDDVSAVMLGQMLEARGQKVRALTHADLMPARLGALADGGQAVVLCFLDPAPSRASLLHIRRIKRSHPGLRVGVMIWGVPEGLDKNGIRSPVEAKLAEAGSLGADFVVCSLDGVMVELGVG
ncbi:AI-2E family transporter [Neogemmobacter tilapiae]|uniref:ABC transporter permease n=1 Tax=Neogemmobacter tilapiae TaxID=875041 RepID=A0A918WKS6_9RHOB|nr:AI-2E family transporter [Gemmobacter tilapiae]GHC54637.1 ABC transporter permease [Gemmobacter tilapiae]